MSIRLLALACDAQRQECVKVESRCARAAPLHSSLFTLFTLHDHAGTEGAPRRATPFALNAVIYTRAVRFNRIEFALVLGIAFGLYT